MEEQKEIVAEYIKCESCGSNMQFNPTTQTLFCESCGTQRDFEQDCKVQELAIAEALSREDIYDKESSVYTCSNCGANIVVNADDVASECPFCSTPFIVKNEDLKGLKPNAVYPFTFNKDKALVYAKKNIKKRWFCPRKFKKDVNADSIKGLYVPCFTFDSNTISMYNGRIGKTRTRTVRTKNGTRTETYVEWRHVSGTLNKFFDDITIATSSRLSQKVLNKITPFNKETIRVYDKSYMSGFFATHYEKDVKTSWEEAKNEMGNLIKKNILSSYNCDRVDYLNVSTSYHETTYKYVLLPIYSVAFKYKSKDYGMVINGNTGKSYGKMPVSPWKVIFTTIVGVAISAVLIWLFNR